jgi:Fuc2NAc and GlcNAc transferase
VSTAAAIGIATGMVSIAMTGLVRRYAIRRNMLDIPNARSSHSLPTPRGGGLGIVAAYAAALLCLGVAGLLRVDAVLVLGACGGIVAISGFLDDRHSLPAKARFAAHLAAAGIYVAWSWHVSAPWLVQAGFGLAGLGALFAVLGLAWSTNLFNFMDGIDGIAASEAVFVSGAGAWISWQHGDPGVTAALGCLGAASGGFLLWNWPPARIFMGDVGSGFLGLMIPAVELLAAGRGPIPLQVWLILGGLFLADATATLVRRIVRGDRWFEAHRLHAYQHLARRWSSHRRVTVTYACINVCWLLPWAWYAATTPARAGVSLLAALTPVVVLMLAAGAGRLERVP